MGVNTMADEIDTTSWQCGAVGSQRAYRVAQLELEQLTFDLEIFDGRVFDPTQLLETVVMTVAQPAELGDRPLIAHGRTAAGTAVTVQALGGSVKFTVTAADMATAQGRCERLVDLN